MRSQRWLLVVAFLSAIVFAAIGTTASAVTPPTVSFTPTTPIVVGGTATVTANYTPSAVSEVTTLTMSSAIGSFSNASTTAGDTITGTTTLTFSAKTAAASTLTATFTCTTAGTTTFTLTQATGPQTGVSNNTLTCNAAPAVALSTGTITVGQSVAVQATYAQTSSQTVTLATTSTIGTFSSAVASTGETVAGANSASISYAAGSTANSTLTGIFVCSQAGTAVFNLTGPGTASSSTLTCNPATTTTTTGAMTVTPPSNSLGLASSVQTTYTPTLSQAIVLTASPALGAFNSASTTTGDSIAGLSTTTLTYSANSASSTTLTANFLCSQAGTVNFTLSQGGATTATGSLLCGSSTNAISVNPSVIYAGQTASVLVSYTSTPGQIATLSSTYGIGTFASGFSSTGELVQGSGTPTLTYATNSAAAATLTATYLCTVSGSASFTFTLGAATYATSAPVTCYGANTGIGGLPYGYNPALTSVIPSTLGITTLSASANPTSLTCGQPATISVLARNAAGGAASDGSQVTLSTTGGSLSQSTVSTIGGSASATLIPPTSTSTVSVSIYGGSGTTSLTIPVNCDSSTLTQYTTAPQQTTAQPVYPPTIAYGQIAPPNTGDGGLLK